MRDSSRYELLTPTTQTKGKFGYQLFNSEGALSKVPQRKYSSRNQLGVTCYSLVDDQRAGYARRHSLGEIDVINV